MNFFLRDHSRTGETPPSAEFLLTDLGFELSIIVDVWNQDLYLKLPCLCLIKVSQGCIFKVDHSDFEVFTSFLMGLLFKERTCSLERANSFLYEQPHTEEGITVAVAAL